ncbi:MAG: hypothetical protein LQ338_002038 [Usnochroma carphineum]|nr:MAG: hypothetical protein LQ338_002038 [Usnochroma carphineum]
MSSIFTFDPDPPKPLSSPWPMPTDKHLPSGSGGNGEAASNDEIPPAMHLAEFGIESLEPEPQDGPTEYKLHLLLRPRRSFSASSTVQKVSGSHLSKSRISHSENNSSLPLHKVVAAPASSNQSRQSRLQNLTTQLLWRLEQSSPHHSASRSDLVIPALPDEVEFNNASRAPGKLLPGLSDSQGALYEIGVADDGSLVGLTNDELNESLAVLHAMASSLGCKVTLRRRIIVGDCQWLEKAGKSEEVAPRLRKEKLWVSEAFIRPDLAQGDLKLPITQGLPDVGSSNVTQSPSTSRKGRNKDQRTDQLRVSLTGSTTSGKSSLLGTLSTSTLDNGRGKSRLSLLKHRHEIASGVTSSVTGSLIGYHDGSSSDHGKSCVHVVNYASGNVSSWTDIHSASDPGRLVFLNDSAGHPRFRRTIVRGLVSWAPHWTICCIAADNEEDTRGKAGATASAIDILGSSCAEIDLAKAHLELCLRLGLPLIVVITKLDLASISALKPTLGKILSVLKSAGRRPEIISCPSEEQSFHTQVIGPQHEAEVVRLLSLSAETDASSMVPIVLTSAVTGKGMDTLHALLRHLPIPELPFTQRVSVSPASALSPFSTLFHIDEIFAAHSVQRSASKGKNEISINSILSGYLHHGALAMGQEVIVGPFSAHLDDMEGPTYEVHRADSCPRIKGGLKTNPNNRILPRPLSGDLTAVHRTSGKPARTSGVWRRVRVCSLRNLRLPVHDLQADQAGTVGLGPSISTTGTNPGPLSANDRIRKGMVLMSIPSQSSMSSLQAYSGFVGIFERTEAASYNPGTSVIAYTASIRAPAKVVDSRLLPRNATPPEEVFDLQDGFHEHDGYRRPSSIAKEVQEIELTCQFLTVQEWFELGSKVLVMPASGLGIANSMVEKADKTITGLDGLVGRIIQGLE